MPSRLGETNLGADCRGFYSAFYRSEAGTVTARLGFECRDGLTCRSLFLQGFSLYPCSRGVKKPAADSQLFNNCNQRRNCK